MPSKRRSAAIRGHEARVEREAATLRKLRLVKAGLMDDLLTGRVRVTEAADDPAA